MAHWIALVFAVGGQLLILRKNRIAFISWNIGNLIYIITSIVTNNIPELSLFVMYLALDSLGFIMWVRSDKKDKEKKLRRKYYRIRGDLLKWRRGSL